VRVISGNFITARPVGIVDGIDFQHFRAGAQGRRGGHHPHAGHGRDGAAVAVWLFTHWRGLQPHHGRSGHQSVASALQADKLIFLTEMPGIGMDAGRNRSAKTTRSTPSCRWLPPKACWPNCPPQLPTDTAFYLQHCVKACKAGVESSHIMPFNVDGAILLEVYVHDGIGTMVVDEKLESLREATSDDVGGILQLIEPFEKDGTLVKRSRTEIERDVGELHHPGARRRHLCMRGAVPLPRVKNR
jgi:amino-acid N-acetyltransferase